MNNGPDQPNAARALKIPHVFVLLTGLIAVVSLASYVLPAGHYQIGDKKRIIHGTYAAVPRSVSAATVMFGESSNRVEGTAAPVGFMEFLTAIPRGMTDKADIIFFIFLIGGTVGVIQRSGAITATLQALVRRIGHSPVTLTVLITIVLAAAGSLAGMGEEFIPLVPVFLMLSAQLGYDRIFALALVFLSADVGFAAATTNPFTLQVAQDIAGLDLNSGIGLRMAFFACAITLTLVHVLRYGARIKRDPRSSLAPFEKHDVFADDAHDTPFTGRHLSVVITSVMLFGLIMAGVLRYGWYMTEMSGGFFLMGILVAILGGLSVDETVKAFVKGMEEMVVAALVVGFAAGVSVVMQDGEIMHSLIHAAASALESFSATTSAVAMLLFQSALNLFVPSGSGQAAVTMPVMAPLADLVGVTRQTAVLAYQFGDGLSNAIIPTSGILMAVLALARVPWSAWFRFVFPLFAQLMVLAGLFLAIAVWIDY